MSGLLLVAVALLVAVTVAAWRLRGERQRLRARLATAAAELQRLQQTFARFAPSPVVEGIAIGGRTNGAERRDVTVLFADLRGFTAFSAALDAETLVRILNEYFVRMSRVVSDHRGQVSKFIGDGLLALFGAHEPNPWQANDAVAAALDMQEALTAYNRELAASGLPTLRLGIGVHRGEAIAGIVGSHELLEFTVIGGTVNLASRVERLTRDLGADILVTEAVRAGLDPRFALEVQEARLVRGLTEPVVTYAVRPSPP